jgi:hypothetical protein
MLLNPLPILYLFIQQNQYPFPVLGHAMPQTIRSEPVSELNHKHANHLIINKYKTSPGDSCPRLIQGEYQEIKGGG